MVCGRYVHLHYTIVSFTYPIVAESGQNSLLSVLFCDVRRSVRGDVCGEMDASASLNLCQDVSTPRVEPTDGHSDFRTTALLRFDCYMYALHTNSCSSMFCFKYLPPTETA